MKLTLNEIIYLKEKFPDYSDLSLFANLNADKSGDEKKTLEEKGILKNGALTDASRDVLNIMAYSKNASQIILKDSYLLLEKYCYKKDEKLLLAESENDGITFNIVEHPEDLVYLISWLTGTSNFKSADCNVVLSKDELIVFMTIFDLQRRSILKNYLGEEDLKIRFKLDAIEKTLNKQFANSLVNLLKANLKIETPQKIKDILDSLVGKNVLDYKDGFSLKGEYMVLVSNLLIPRIVGNVNVLELNEDNKVLQLQSILISAGVRDNIILMISDAGVELTTLSANELLTTAKNLLQCPDLKN